jgi:hypothetical protein
MKHKSRFNKQRLPHFSKMKLHTILNKFSLSILEKLRFLDLFARSQAVEIVEWEYEELQHIFGLLTLGSFIGSPSPPLPITLDLMPYLEKELQLMLEKTDTASGPLSDLFSLLNVG